MSVECGYIRCVCKYMLLSCRLRLSLSSLLLCKLYLSMTSSGSGSGSSSSSGRISKCIEKRIKKMYI